MKSSKKKKKSPRQKVQKGLDKIFEWLKTQEPKDLAEIALMAGLAAHSVNTIRNPDGSINPANALFGPIALKLAQSPNLASGTAGVAGLGALGLATLGFDPSLLIPQPLKEPLGIEEIPVIPSPKMRWTFGRPLT